MTEVSQRPRTAESAAAVVTEFFDRYRAHDVDGMTDRRSINAGFSYVPVEIWGKQRVLRGDGKVCTVGKPLWTGLIASFPNLSNTVHSVTSNDDGDVVAQIDVEGTQQLAWGLIAPAGRHYPEYVATQREKEAAVYAVKAALQRSSAFDSLTEGWKSATKMHFGGVALVEYAAVLAELKMARFGLNGSWRNMATFGQLDELRHAAGTTFLGHEVLGKDAPYDWAQQA